MKKCRICNQPSQIKPINRIINKYAFVECSTCHTVMIDHKPSGEELKKLYDYLFSRGEYEQHRIEFENLSKGIIPRSIFRTSILKKLEKITPERKLIEIGGGTGSFGMLAKSRGWDYTDYDISEVSVQNCHQLGLNAHRFEANTVPPLQQNSAHVIVMWEVIEHIWDLADYLSVIRKALCPGGIFVFSTPNYLTPILKDTDQWGMLSSPPIHVNFFTYPSLKKILLLNFPKVNLHQRRFYQPDLNKKSLNYYFKSLLVNQAETLYGFAYV